MAGPIRPPPADWTPGAKRREQIETEDGRGQDQRKRDRRFDQEPAAEAGDREPVGERKRQDDQNDRDHGGEPDAEAERLPVHHGRPAAARVGRRNPNARSVVLASALFRKVRNAPAAALLRDPATIPADWMIGGCMRSGTS